MNKYLVPLIKEFKINADKNNAAYMAKYMKFHFSYYGIKSPEAKKIASQFYKINGKPKVDEWQSIVKELWQLPERENQYFAQNLSLKMKRHWIESDIDLFEWMTLNKSWWDTVDFIASNLVGNYFIQFPDNKEQIIEKYITHDDMWLNRIAILFQLKCKANTNEKLLAKNCLHHINHKDFFIRKAIGWALREYAKTNPDWVLKLVSENEFSKLSKKEALKHIT